MRTTLAIDDGLLRRAKQRAHAEGKTLGQYVEDAVRRDLAAAPPPPTAVELPIFTRGTGMRPGIDPSSNRALYDALDSSGDLT